LKAVWSEATELCIEAEAEHAPRPPQQGTSNYAGEGFESGVERSDKT